MENRLWGWEGICLQSAPELVVQNYVTTVKLEKVGFVTLGKPGQDGGLGFCYSNSVPRFSNENRVVVAGPGTLEPQAPAPLFTLPRVSEDVSDIHRCRSTFQGTGRPSPITLPFHQPLGKTHKLAKKFPNSPDLPPPPRFSCDHEHSE